MASRGFSKALRPMARQLAAKPATQQRTFVAARSLVRASAQVSKAFAGQQQTRGVKTMDFAGHKEDVYGKRETSPRIDPAMTRERLLTFMPQSVPTGPRRSSW